MTATAQSGNNDQPTVQLHVGNDPERVTVHIQTTSNPDSPFALALGLTASGKSLIPTPHEWASWQNTTMLSPTVSVDNTSQSPGKARVALQAHAEGFKAVRLEAPAVNESRGYARSVALVETAEGGSYLFDCFNCSGGRMHTYTLHALPGIMAIQGIAPLPTPPFLTDSPLRNYRTATRSTPGWIADWQLETGDNPRHLRYTGLTDYADVTVAESPAQDVAATTTQWVPWIFVQRHISKPDLDSTFIGIMEPYRGRPAIASARRLPLETMNGRALPESFTGVEISFNSVYTDVLLLSNGTAGSEVMEPFHRIHFAGAFAWIRFHGSLPVRIVACNAAFIKIGDVSISTASPDEVLELDYDPQGARVLQGKTPSIYYGAEKVTILPGTHSVDSRKNPAAQ